MKINNLLNDARLNSTNANGITHIIYTQMNYTVSSKNKIASFQI